MTGRAVVVEVVGFMVGVSSARIRCRVAAKAVCGCACVALTVTRLALQRCVGSGKRKTSEIVIESRRLPRCSRVAGSAIVIEAVGFMVRIDHTGVLNGMAGITERIRVCIAIGVAGNTLLRLMCSGERETGAAVIPTRGLPGSRCMAIDTADREACVAVLRACGCRVDFAVAGVAVVRRCHISITMAGDTI